MAGVGGVFTNQPNIFNGAFSQKWLTAIYEKKVPSEMFKWFLSMPLWVTHTHIHTHIHTHTHTQNEMEMLHFHCGSLEKK